MYYYWHWWYGCKNGIICNGIFAENESNLASIVEFLCVNVSCVFFFFFWDCLVADRVEERRKERKINFTFFFSSTIEWFFWIVLFELLGSKEFTWELWPFFLLIISNERLVANCVVWSLVDWELNLWLTWVKIQ